jgi:zinc transport system substrate-binding protein
MNYLQWRGLTLLVSLGILTGCSSPPTASNPETQISASETTSEPLDITVSILPQEYFVEKIGGDRVEVNIMVEPGASPATYEPKPQQMKALSEAEAYVKIWLELRIANLSSSIQHRAILLVIYVAGVMEELRGLLHQTLIQENSNEHASVSMTMLFNPHSLINLTEQKQVDFQRQSLNDLLDLLHGNQNRLVLPSLIRV